MGGRSVIALLVVAAGLLSVRALDGRQVRPDPGPTTGVVTIAGKVDIGTLPTVVVSQGSDWRADVRVQEQPPVAAASLPFLRTGGRYEIVWDSVTPPETVVVSKRGPGGWVEVSGDRSRWINLDTARQIAPVK